MLVLDVFLKYNMSDSQNYLQSKTIIQYTIPYSAPGYLVEAGNLAFESMIEFTNLKSCLRNTHPNRFEGYYVGLVTDDDALPYVIVLRPSKRQFQKLTHHKSIPTPISITISISITMTSSGMQIIERLRQEDFNLETENKLESHPYVLAAEAGTLTLAQRRAFCYEQYAIQRSDAISFASLAGHRSFRPKSLTTATVPDGDDKDIFQFLLSGEVYASSLLLDHAKSLGINNERNIAHYPCSSLAQAYPSYWARMALDQARAAGAAACAVNFPAWGRMCSRLYEAAPSKDGMDFIQFFSTPIDSLDEMAAAVIDSEENVQYEDLVQHVRLLQNYEVLFWDAVYAAKD